MTLRAWTTAALTLARVVFVASGVTGQPVLGGALPGSPPGALFPADNWWSVDVSGAPVDANSDAYVQFINNCAGCCPTGGRRLHPDFGGNVSPGSVQTYGIPYAVVDGNQAKRSVIFFYDAESDGVDQATGQSFPFYPLPDQAIGQPHWVEGGDPASVDLRDDQDRHLIVVDRDRRHLYELWNVWYDTAHGQWYAGSGAFFDMNTNNRRPETWTSADAAGLAILPGLVRYDEVYASDPTGAYEIPHAFRVTVRRTNGHVFPASHTAGSTSGAPPMGARLRLKAGKDIAGFPPEIRRIFGAMKKHGLIVADNGTDMYVTGTYDPRWNNDVLNPAFGQLSACDFEVMQLGWKPAALSLAVSANQSTFTTGQALTSTVTYTNPGLASVVDVYMGLLFPDGHTIAFFTGGSFALGDAANPASFRPAATGVSLAAPASATVPDVFAYPWTAAAPRGGYVLFVAAVKANTPTEIVTLATAPLSLQ
jgi:hypothetical protein